MNAVFNHFNFISASQTKHEMLVQGISDAIASGELQYGQALPSVNDFMSELSFSRMTVLKALNELKDRGVIESKNRVGYFVKSEDTHQFQRVMLILTAFNPYHEALYKSLMEIVRGKGVTVDLYFHHGNGQLLATLLKENTGKYGIYIVTPVPDKDVLKIMNRIPAEKLLQIVRPVCGNHEVSYISQDFYDEVISALGTIEDKIRKYEEFILLYPTGLFHSPDIKRAFKVFCKDRGIRHRVIQSDCQACKLKGKAFFVIEDTHLISLIKKAEEKDLKLGFDMGILSYNDTPMKEIIRQGITVISTDFNDMGMLAGNFILNRNPVQKVVQTRIAMRNSL